MNFVPKIQEFADFERDSRALMSPPPGPYQTQFGAIPYRDRHVPAARRHEWLIKGLLTRGEQGMLLGASQAGKSFLALDLSMSIARGVPWMGKKCRQGLVIYHAGESAKGVRDKRMPAYDKANGLDAVEDLPFVLLTLPLDLYSSDDDTTKMIAECRYWQQQYSDHPLELLVIDTFNAATPGADENAGKDVGAIRRRCKRIEMELGCAVLLVHHKNAAGTKARGHSSMFADVENVLDVSLVTAVLAGSKEPVVLKDIRGRKVRVAKVTKLKDGTDEEEFRFTLKSVVLGQDEDGDDKTSCVIDLPDMGVVEPEEAGRVGPKPAKVPTKQYNLLRTIEDAIKASGREAPPGVPAPHGVQLVEWKYVRELFDARWIDGDIDPAKIKKAQTDAIKAAGAELVRNGYIQKHVNWVWRTKKLLPGDRRRQETQSTQDEAFEARIGASASDAMGDFIHGGDDAEGSAADE